jgi:hypothetical protein
MLRSLPHCIGGVREKNIGVTLWKECLLSSDGHQWHPYQQNEQSSLS